MLRLLLTKIEQYFYLKEVGRLGWEFSLRGCIMDSMNETTLILNALQKSPPPKKRKKVMKEIVPSIVDGPDAISDLVKKKERKDKSQARHKRKRLSQWTGSDFIKYLGEMLSNHGKYVRDGIRDKDAVGRIHDKMVDQIGSQMSNEVLKQYFEWWVSSHAPFLHDNTVYVDALAGEKVLSKFLSRFNTESMSETKSVIVDAPDISAETLFDMGGLPMVLCSKGIVITCEMLKQKDESGVFSKVSSALRNLSEDSVRQSMEVTLKFAPYKKDQSLDFMSVGRAAIEYYGLKEYKNVSYQDYFEC